VQDLMVSPRLMAPYRCISRSDIVREMAQIPDDEAIMTCVAMGYPDDAFVRYVGFAED
jgi:hypothetical protein